LGPRDHPEHKEFKGERVLLERQVRPDHQEEVFQMVTSAESVKEYLIIKWLSLFMNCEDLKVYLDKALQDLQESLEKQDLQVSLDLLVHLENEDSWACLDTKGLKEPKAQEENQVLLELKEHKELVCKAHREFLVRRVHRDQEERAKLEVMDSKDLQGLADTPVCEAKLVLLGLLVLASNVLQ